MKKFMLIVISAVLVLTMCSCSMFGNQHRYFTPEHIDFPDGIDSFYFPDYKRCGDSFIFECLKAGTTSDAPRTHYFYKLNLNDMKFTLFSEVELLNVTNMQGHSDGSVTLTASIGEDCTRAIVEIDVDGKYTIRELPQFDKSVSCLDCFYNEDSHILVSIFRVDDGYILVTTDGVLYMDKDAPEDIKIEDMRIIDDTYTGSRGGSPNYECNNDGTLIRYEINLYTSTFTISRLNEDFRFEEIGEAQGTLSTLTPGDTDCIYYSTFPFDKDLPKRPKDRIIYKFNFDTKKSTEFGRISHDYSCGGLYVLIIDENTIFDFTDGKPTLWKCKEAVETD